MAHNLNYNQQKGKHSFFSVKEKAWHGLGQIISDYPTSEKAIIHAGLDYQVEKRPLFTYDANNNFWDNSEAISDIELPNHFTTVRADTDQVLGVVGNDYEIVQNINAFSFLTKLSPAERIFYMKRQAH